MQKPSCRMKKYAIIAAGGAGIRMGNATPKQFLELNGKPILWYSVKAFIETFPDIQVIVVAPTSHLEQARNICSPYTNVQFTEGGNTRFSSVKNGLGLVKGESVVFVHDAVRCLVTKELISRCFDAAMEYGSAIPAISLNDSVRVIKGNSSDAIDRDLLRIIQTPQVFKSDILLPAFETGDNGQFTDEATVVEASGKAVHLVEGEDTNIKITRPGDLLIAEKILAERSFLQKP
jgi:2-C-methyl-D-erythritol 4-phosphate cytidylyltransferase